MKNVEIEVFKSNDAAKFSKARFIRTVVFIVEQKVAETEEFDEFEQDCVHYLINVDDKSIGTARWRLINDKVKLERFAILEQYRGKKYGDLLLKKVIEDASKENKVLYLHAQLKAIPFYERRGFQKVGDLFVECEIEHYKMVRGGITN
mgnify:CR=1 FL=1|tara:strand:- start:647 stop:1090 length:444 start_codon:yes stop_codon:yes gene_type:complete